LNAARETDDPKAKRQMLAAAEVWKELAEKGQKNWNGPVSRAKERKLAEIDAAIAAFNRSNAAHSEETKTRFAERAVEQLQQVLEAGPDGRQ